MKFIRIPARCLCLAVVLACSSAMAATNEINSTNDTLTVGTLRWAITLANTNPGPDLITFHLSAGASTSPTGQLPRITNAFTTIDGTTQSGYSITNLVRIYGNSSITNCLDITASNCTIKSLAIYGYRRTGIYLHLGHRAVVQGCHLLTNGFAGIEAVGNWHLIGGTNAAQRNVISANTNGIYLAQGGSNNTIIGNFIGTDVSGTASNGNTQSGIYIDGNSENLIGSVTNGARNIVSANAHGIYLNEDRATRNVIVNNYIGLASNGTTRMGNWNSGIYVDQAPQNRIGGTNVPSRNYISANLKGIVLFSSTGGSFSNVIQGNYIGLDAVGTMKSNDWYAIQIQHSPSNVIGGAVSGAGNVIGGGQYGIYMEGTGTYGTVIQGNKVGTDPSGSSARPFAYTAISMADSRFTRIGGTNDYARNLICGAGQNGIMASSSQGGGHIIENNYIGVDLGGTIAIGNSGAGINLNSPNCRIGGTNVAYRNVICDNDGGGIVVAGTNATNIVIFGNYIGVDATGVNALGNGGEGVMASAARDVWIGKGVAGCGNVISGNGNDGVEVRGGSREVRILNNYIGVDATGAQLMTNAGYGVYCFGGGPTNYIGGLPSERNVIAGNSRGISVSECTGVVIRANLVGLGTNSAVLGNRADGIAFLSSREFEIGGASSAEGNLIGGSGGNAITLSLSSNGYVGFNSIGVLESGAVVSNAINGLSMATVSRVTVSDNRISAGGGQGIRLFLARDCTLSGNYIGTDWLGSSGLGNMSDGIYVDDNSVSNTIGGFYGVSGNVISGNGGSGIELNGNNISAITIIGNKIGTDKDGAYAISNTGAGIGSCGAHHIRIGGTNVGDRNIISGNDDGVSVGCSGSSNNVIQGNYIGVDASGTNAIPNAQQGIWLGSGTSNTIIGATNENAGNIIAFNRDGGVVVYQDQGNSILGNSIFRNQELGIDLGSDGVTPNDSADPDAGANLLQNYPVILSATNDGANAVVKGYLDSRPSRTYLIELFGSRDPDLTGYGQGQALLGRRTVTTDGSGMANFTGVVSTVGFLPNFVTATATDTGSGNTSEFSYRCLMDSDGDGMGDGYESEYFGGYTNGNPGGHADSDGIDNLGEFLAETDPTVASSCLRVTRFWRESGDRFFTVPVSDCRKYSTQIAWDLMSPLQVWWDWGCGSTRTNGSITFNEGSSTYNPTFNRVIPEIP